MHKTKVKVRLKNRPTEEIEVSVREALSLRAQGLLLDSKKAAPAAAKEAAK